MVWNFLPVFELAVSVFVRKNYLRLFSANGIRTRSSFTIMAMNHSGKRNSHSHRTSSAAFSLVEVMVGMFVLSLLALGMTKLLLFSKVTAEDNLYEATALTVAVSIVEQMQGASLNLLENPQEVGGDEVFEMVIGNNVKSSVVLGEENVLDVPIVTDSGGSVAKTLALKVTPRIGLMENGKGYWLSIEYAYDHPRTNRTRTQIIRSARSTVPTA